MLNELQITYQDTSFPLSITFMFPLHQTERYQKWRPKPNFLNKLWKHTLKRLLKTISNMVKKTSKNPTPNFHCQEIIYLTYQKWTKKLCSKQPHATALTISVTALDHDQTRKSIRWHMKEPTQILHLFVSYFKGLSEFSQLLSSKWKVSAKCYD